MTLSAEARSYDATNNVVPLTEPKSALPAGRGEAKRDDVLIHVRFHPNPEACSNTWPSIEMALSRSWILLVDSAGRSQPTCLTNH
jgi:hypothetical protein